MKKKEREIPVNIYKLMRFGPFGGLVFYEMVRNTQPSSFLHPLFASFGLCCYSLGSSFFHGLTFLKDYLFQSLDSFV